VRVDVFQGAAFSFGRTSVMRAEHSEEAAMALHEWLSKRLTDLASAVDSVPRNNAQHSQSLVALWQAGPKHLWKS